TFVINQGKQRSAKLIGVTPAFFDISNIRIRKGQHFSSFQIENAEAVCIIGSGVQKKFFTGDDPIGKQLKVGNQWLTVIGVTAEKIISDKAIDNLGIRNYNMDIYTPIETVLIRYKNRALLLAGEQRRRMRSDNEEEEKSTSFNYHQIDRMVVQVENSEYLNASAEVISRMLKRKHNNVVDFEITIPQQLLEQQQKTKDIFNLVLMAIAGISLLVGGIGIMNIMLASVLERTREIGTRLAIGAKRSDIISQFLFEALLISLSGGVIGIILGVVSSYLVSEFTNIQTIISFWAIIASFVVSSATGLIFGLSPAYRAAKQNPVESLRYE
ncbi:MAG: ABC transporter permease, partial [Owenweeksia sp.]